MTTAIYVKDKRLENDPRLQELRGKLLSAGLGLYDLQAREELREGTDMLLSIGGDGTFLSAAKRIAGTGVPVLGINLGRLGFLSEHSPEEAVETILSGNYSIEDRRLLETRVSGVDVPDSFWPYSLNEVTVHRAGAAMLGVDVSIDGRPVPTYWADGLLVATSSGSTAYSLSVGGPICMPDSKVLIVAPIAPHNLNVRPLIVPDTSLIEISVRSRDGHILLTTDNRNLTVDGNVKLAISLAQFSLKRVRPHTADFIKALTSKLFWGEDVRNGAEQ